MIGLLIGHTRQDQGAVRHDGVTERQLLIQCRNLLLPMVTPAWCIIDCPEGRPRDRHSGILDRIDMAKEAHIALGIELHINNVPAGQPDDYALILHSISAAAAASALRAEMHNVLRSAGVARWVLSPIPHPDWPRRGAIQDAPYPAIIFEPWFINNRRHQVDLQEMCAALATFLSTYEVHQ